MADIPQVLANYDALVGVALGAGLAYGFGALNRRHQEAREDKTRWYEARREAYAALLIAAQRVSVSSEDATPEEKMSELADELSAAMGAVRLVGSPEVVEAANNVFIAVLEDVELFRQEVLDFAQKVEDSDEELDPLEELENLETTRVLHMPEARKAFEKAARKDLGHPRYQFTCLGLFKPFPAH
jgi:imidazolonepropionase-like amidohydrolase